jgi:hypothetical protein
MSEKHNNTSKKDNKNTIEVNILVDKKLEFFKDIIQKTILHVQKNKTLDILGISDVSTCIDKLNEISKKINEINELTQIKDHNTSADNKINGLQFINNELSGLFKNYGTQNLDDLLIVCFGNNYKITSTATNGLQITGTITSYNFENGSSLFTATIDNFSLTNIGDLISNVKQNQNIISNSIDYDQAFNGCYNVTVNSGAVINTATKESI